MGDIRVAPTQGSPVSGGRAPVRHNSQSGPGLQPGHISGSGGAYRCYKPSDWTIPWAHAWFPVGEFR